MSSTSRFERLHSEKGIHRCPNGPPPLWQRGKYWFWLPPTRIEVRGQSVIKFCGFSSCAVSIKRLDRNPSCCSKDCDCPWWWSNTRKLKAMCLAIGSNPWSNVLHACTRSSNCSFNSVLSSPLGRATRFFFLFMPYNAANNRIFAKRSVAKSPS